MRLLDQTIESILPGVQKPSRYIGGESNQVVKDPETATARVVWSYPDAYEIGISNQKLHARGPMALSELTSTTWVVTGTGQIRT